MQIYTNDSVLTCAQTPSYLRWLDKKSFENSVILFRICKKSRNDIIQENKWLEVKAKRRQVTFKKSFEVKILTRVLTDDEGYPETTYRNGSTDLSRRDLQKRECFTTWKTLFSKLKSSPYQKFLLSGQERPCTRRLYIFRHKNRFGQ